MNTKKKRNYSRRFLKRTKGYNASSQFQTNYSWQNLDIFQMYWHVLTRRRIQHLVLLYRWHQTHAVRSGGTIQTRARCEMHFICLRTGCTLVAMTGLERKTTLRRCHMVLQASLNGTQVDNRKLKTGSYDARTNFVKIMKPTTQVYTFE